MLLSNCHLRVSDTRSELFLAAMIHLMKDEAKSVLSVAAGLQLPWSQVTPRPMSARTILLSSLSGAAHAGATHNMKTMHSPFVSSPSCVFHNSLGLCFFLQTVPRKPIWQGQVPWVCLPLRKFSFFMKLQIFYSWKEFSIPGQPQFVTRNR